VLPRCFTASRTAACVTTDNAALVWLFGLHFKALPASGDLGLLELAPRDEAVDFGDLLLRRCGVGVAW